MSALRKRRKRRARGNETTKTHTDAEREESAAASLSLSLIHRSARVIQKNTQLINPFRPQFSHPFSSQKRERAEKNRSTALSEHTKPPKNEPQTRREQNHSSLWRRPFSLKALKTGKERDMCISAWGFFSFPERLHFSSKFLPLYNHDNVVLSDSLSIYMCRSSLFSLSFCARGGGEMTRERAFRRPSVLWCT